MPDDAEPSVPEARSAVPEARRAAADARAAVPDQPGEVKFRVDSRLSGLKVAGAVIFALFALTFHADRARLGFAALAALVLAVYAARDLAVPHRLSADAEGVTLVEGFARRRRLGWAEIERVRVDERRRLGTRSELLEIDTGETLHLFSGYDLGVPVWQAARTLAGIAPAGLTHLPAPG
jgi:hypothetical protein